MNAANTGFSVVFPNEQYVIPFFQRPYVWEEEDLSRFLESMREISTTYPNSNGTYQYYIWEQ